MILLAADSSGIANQVVEATSGMVSLAWLIPLLPLLGFVAVLIASPKIGNKAASISIGAAVATFVVAAAVAIQVITSPDTYVVSMPTWIDIGGFTVTFDLFVDQLTAVMLLVVTGVACWCTSTRSATCMATAGIRDSSRISTCSWRRC